MSNPVFRFRGSEPPTQASRASILEPQAEGPVAELYLYDPIDSWGGWWGVSAKEFAATLAGLPEDTTEIRLHINSPGGEIWDAMAIVNQLRRHPANVVGIVDGLAASAASLIAVTCDETIMGVGSQMMIHDAWNIEIGNEAAMLAMASRLSKDSDASAAIYAAKAGGTAAEWRDVMRSETWYAAQEAVEAGLADRTVDEVPEVASKALVDPSLSLFRYAGRAQAPTPRIPQRAMASAPKHSVSAEPEESNRKESAMSDALQAGIRERLGITDADLDEQGLLSALDEALSEQADPAPVVAPGTVLIDAAQLAELRNQAAEGAQARAEQVAHRRDAIIDAAVADGRVSPANRAAWRAALDADEAATEPLLAGLAKNGAVPVDPAGHANADQANDAYPAHWKR